MPVENVLCGLISCFKFFKNMVFSSSQDFGSSAGQLLSFYSATLNPSGLPPGPRDSSARPLPPPAVLGCGCRTPERMPPKQRLGADFGLLEGVHDPTSRILGQRSRGRAKTPADLSHVLAAVFSPDAIFNLSFGSNLIVGR